MYRLILNNGLSYHGIVTASLENAIVSVDAQETAEYLIESGYFKMIGQKNPERVIPTLSQDEGNLKNEDCKIREKKELKKYSKAELEAYAAEVGVDISGCSKNEQRIAAIKAVLLTNAKQSSEEVVMSESTEGSTIEADFALGM